MVVDVSQVSSYPQMIQGCDLSTQNVLRIREIVRFIFASAFERKTTGQNFVSYRSEISFVFLFSVSAAYKKLKKSGMGKGEGEEEEKGEWG